MLHGIHPALTGDLLRELDRLGHGDALLVADANYPAYGVGAIVVEIPLDAPTVLGAVRTLIPIDTYDGPSVHLMRPVDGDADASEVQDALVTAVAAPAERITSLDRHDFYDAARKVRLVVRTAEVRPYGNLVLRTGVVIPGHGWTPACAGPDTAETQIEAMCSGPRAGVPFSRDDGRRRVTGATCGA